MISFTPQPHNTVPCAQHDAETLTLLLDHSIIFVALKGLYEDQHCKEFGIPQNGRQTIFVKNRLSVYSLL